MEQFDEPDEGEPFYDLWQEGWRPLNHGPLNEEVEAHIERCFGKASTVVHELLSLHVHLDVNVIPPSRGRRFTTYVTSGMSDLPMKVPDPIGPKSWSRAELVIALPGPPESHEDHYLIDRMRNLARYPHIAGTWLGLGHTLQAEGGEALGDDTRLSGFVFGMPIACPLTSSIEAFELTLETGELVHFFALVPIYPEELALKLKDGNSDRLFELLDAAQATELYAPNRSNGALIAPPKSRGLFAKFLRR
jgi:hypothetical protein